MKHLFTTTLLAALALPFAAAAQDRYPTLKPEQLSPEQKAYIDNLAKPPRNNTTYHWADRSTARGSACSPTASKASG